MPASDLTPDISPAVPDCPDELGYAARLTHISEHVLCYQDTCNVYILQDGDSAVLVDFGDGSVLDLLPALGIRRVSAVLMTHHHRDQGQGLPLAVQAGIPIWVPQVEQDLFQGVEDHWQSREIDNNYNSRQDRFSLLEPVPVAGVLHDYSRHWFGSLLFTILPTPGHTTGSISLWVEIDKRRLVFTGDLIAAPGKVWSLAATQWAYNGGEGLAFTVLSALDIKDRRPDVLLPSHGDPILDPTQAIDLLVHFLNRIMQYRNKNQSLFDLRERPYAQVSPHLLAGRTGMSNTYVLLSESGKALFIDFGYDFMAGIPAGSDRASRRPWLYTIPALKRDFGITQIEAVVPTHYHDDHVAGINLLREVEGTQVWAASNYADILARPTEHDLPCLWYDPIPVDRILPLGLPIVWEEHTLELYAMPGHTLYEVAISFQVDGQRFLAIGDQYEVDDNGVFRWNYVYPNRFQPGDYHASAALICRLQPDMILTGHWGPRVVTPGLYDWLDELGVSLEQLHSQVNMPEADGLGADAFAARIQPYQVHARGGEAIQFQVEVHNPYPKPALARIRPVVPAGWQLDQSEIEILLEARSTGFVRFLTTPPAGLQARRARLAVDLAVGERKFGQQAEALVTLE